MDCNLLVGRALKYLKGKGLDNQVDSALDRLLVEFGKEILQIVPGKVSTEVDARFSFDTGASVEKALHIIEVRRCTRSRRMCNLHLLAIQDGWHWQRASSHQACFYLGRHQGCSYITIKV